MQLFPHKDHWGVFSLNDSPEPFINLPKEKHLINKRLVRHVFWSAGTQSSQIHKAVSEFRVGSQKFSTKWDKTRVFKFTIKKSHNTAHYNADSDSDSGSGSPTEQHKSPC